MDNRLILTLSILISHFWWVLLILMKLLYLFELQLPPLVVRAYLRELRFLMTLKLLLNLLAVLVA